MIYNFLILFQKIFTLLCLSSTLKPNSAVKWGAEYFIKCHTSEYEFYGQVNEPDKLDEYWGRPEDLPEVYDVRSYKESSQTSISTQIKKDIQSLAKRIRNEMIFKFFFILPSIFIFRVAENKIPGRHTTFSMHLGLLT